MLMAGQVGMPLRATARIQCLTAHAGVVLRSADLCDVGLCRILEPEFGVSGRHAFELEEGWSAIARQI